MKFAVKHSQEVVKAVSESNPRHRGSMSYVLTRRILLSLGLFGLWTVAPSSMAHALGMQTANSQVKTYGVETNNYTATQIDDEIFHQLIEQDLGGNANTGAARVLIKYRFSPVTSGVRQFMIIGRRQTVIDDTFSIQWSTAVNGAYSDFSTPIIFNGAAGVEQTLIGNIEDRTSPEIWVKIEDSKVETGNRGGNDEIRIDYMQIDILPTSPMDNFTITLTPVGERGVMITTTTIALGSLSLGTTQYTGGAQGVVVTSTGSIAPLEYTMQASIAGGWSLSTDGYPDTDDELAVHALFNSAAALLADFEGSGIAVTKHLLTTSAGQVGDVAGKYEGNQDLDSLALNISRNLWMQLKLPKVTTIETEQTVTVTVTAEAAN